MNEQDIIDRLREAIQSAGSQRAFAKQHGISTQYINDVLRGRREIGQKILEVLGVEKIITYRLREEKSADDS